MKTELLKLWSIVALSKEFSEKQGETLSEIAPEAKDLMMLHYEIEYS